MTGTLITADYNLSQIAEVKELKVMNLSDLVIAQYPSTTRRITEHQNCPRRKRKNARNWIFR